MDWVRSAAAPVILLTMGIQINNCSADPIVPVSHCSENGAPVACKPAQTLGAAGVDFTDSGLGTPVLDVSATATAIPSVLFGSPDVVSAESSITSMFWVKAQGFIRPGLASYSLIGDIENRGGSGFVSIGGLGSCGAPPPCQKSGTLVPFTLGTPFPITLWAHALGEEGSAGSLGHSRAHLELFDVTGQPVNIVEATVPEPASYTLLSGALLAMLSAVGINRLIRRNRSN